MRTRRSRIIQFPDEYAALESAVGTAWLTRREMFELVDAAQQTQMAAQPATSRWLGSILFITLTLLVVCVILAAIAAALVLSPSLARTRRAISAAYQPTPIPATTAPVATPTAPTAAGTLDSPLQPQPTETVGPDEDERDHTLPPAVGTATLEPPIPSPTLSLPVPPSPTSAPAVLDSPLPKPEVALPPTFTPPPVTATAQPAPEVSPTLLPSPTPTVQAPVTVTPPPTASPEPANPPTLPTPVTMGSVLFQGTVRIRAIQPSGFGPNQADEYVELYNEGAQQVDLNGWSLKAIRTADNTIIDTYLFGNGAIIAAGQVCRIYTNVLIAPDNCGFSGGFASDAPIWPDNGGARASLFNQGNIEYARLTY